MSQTPSAILGSDLRVALVAMVRKRVPESEVEDIVQSTLADAIESPHAPQDSESLRRWIFGIAKNKVVDYHRRAGRETFELPEVPGKPAPHAEADLLRWAEKHLPPGEENKATLDWMLREGDGEKLESIAKTEKVPAPRVRQRVSRLRRHLKSHWQKEVALLAAIGVLVTILVLVTRRQPEPIAPITPITPITNEDLPRAAEIRRQALDRCVASEWKDCIDRLDEAKRLDPAGDARPEVRKAREDAAKALAPAPSAVPATPSDVKDTTAPPPKVAPTPTPSPSSSLTPSELNPKVAPPKKSIGPKTYSTEVVPPVPSPFQKTTKPMPPKKALGVSEDGNGGSSLAPAK